MVKLEEENQDGSENWMDWLGNGEDWSWRIGNQCGIEVGGGMRRRKWRNEETEVEMAEK